MRHTLPGEGGSSDWFLRLNPFEQQETRRQVEFKRRHWPGLPDGAWYKRPDLTYPHILPGDDPAPVFYSPIASDLLEYCRTNDIAVHSEAMNLRSSQVCCFNVLFPLRQNLELAAHALGDLLPAVEEVTAIEFEYTGPASATEWLGEPAGGKRGANRTSIDAAVWWRSGGQSYLTLVEWKYTERSFGTCGGYLSAGNRDKAVCESLDIHSASPGRKCYLTGGRNSRRYWEHLAEAGIDLSAMAEVQGCPFRGPFYQLMRQFILAAHIRAVVPVDQVFVASVEFRGNASLQTSPPALSPLGHSITKAWNACLKGVPPMLSVNAEGIVQRLRERPEGADAAWTEYLEERYGL